MMVAMNFLDDRLPPTFWNKAIPEPMSGCWLWIGRMNYAGYGRSQRDGRDVLTHRVTFESAYGSLPLFGSGLELDHKCRTRSCCNPEHLELVTHAENIRRGDGGLHHRIRTHCRSGHPYDLFFDGYRRCSLCTTAAKRKYKAKARAARRRKETRQ